MSQQMVTPPGAVNPLQLATKTVTFDGTAGGGAVGSVAFFTVTGQVIVEYLVGMVGTTLAGAGATIKLGTTNQTAQFIAATTATTMTSTNSIWISTTATNGALALPAAMKAIIVAENIIATVATADITGGVLTLYCYYRPLTGTSSVA